VIFLRVGGKEPSIRNIADALKAVFGKAFRWDFIRATMRKHGGFQPGASGHSLTRDGEQPGAPGEQPGNLRTGAVENLERQKGEAATEPTESETPTAPSRRTARPAKAYPEIPDDLRDDVDRLIANDAAGRADGKIADSIVEADLLTLRRALEKRGVDALRHGIDVALRKGLGLRFAAGCVRRYDLVRDGAGAGQLPLVGGAPRGGPQRHVLDPKIPDTADAAVFYELALPHEDFNALNSRLMAAKRSDPQADANWRRLQKLSPKPPRSPRTAAAS
jgi:hypothetical protein